VRKRKEFGSGEKKGEETQGVRRRRVVERLRPPESINREKSGHSGDWDRNVSSNGWKVDNCVWLMDS